MNCNFIIGFWSEVTPDAWIQTIGTIIGSFLGAYLAGKYAINVMKEQFRRQQKDKNEEFIKQITNFSSSVRVIIFEFGEILELLDKENKEYADIQKFQSHTFKIDEYLEKLLTIDEKAFSVDTYITCKQMLSKIKSAKTIAAGLVGLSSTELDPQLKKLLETDVQFLSSELKRLEKLKDIMWDYLDGGK
ncbi:hypothetical protein ACO1DI_28385 [Priestia sp. 40]|uniref:hypothetical protein n=1 Tax=Priestia sp. 40 TaxID=3394459 RepID=UPI003BF6259A